MVHGDAQEGKWRGNWRMEGVASTLHTTSEHAVSSITTADAHTSTASSRLNWHPRRFKWTHPFRRKTKSGFCACDITFQLASNSHVELHETGAGEMIDRSGGRMFLQVQVQCICGHEKRTDTLCRSNCGLATFCEELLPLKQNRNYVLLRLQQSASLHALHAPQKL